MADRPALARFARTWIRDEPLLLLALPIAWALLVCSSSYVTDPDSYFHVGCARRIFEGGCLRTFPWLPYTTLADPFPNLYLGQHILLAPIAGVLPPTLALEVSILLLSSGLALSLFLVLRRQGVSRAAPWVVLGMLAVPEPLVYALYLKGAATFLILLVWFVDAVWAARVRRTFALAWLSVYVYIGATVLVPFVVVHVLVTRATTDRWRWPLLVATVAGIAAGLIVNLGWPAHWGHIMAELRTIFVQDPRLVPGDLRGAEWAALTGPQLVSLSAAALIAWTCVLIRRLGRAEPAPIAAISGSVCALGLFGAAMLTGTKMLELFAIFSLLAVPMIARTVAWPRWLPLVAAAVAAVLGVRNLINISDEMHRPGLPHPADYRELAAWLDARTDPGEVIVAPWDDMPGLFLYGHDQRFVAGWNVQFLLDGDLRRFNGYYLLFEGQVADPEHLLPQLFDGARFLIVRRQAHSPGELALTAQLDKNPHFEEVAGPVTEWRIFRVRR
jgi:hypothetical protein